MDAVNPELVGQVQPITELVLGVAAAGSIRERWNGHLLMAMLAIVIDG